MGSMEVVASEDDGDNEDEDLEGVEDIWTTQAGKIKFAITSDVEGNIPTN